MGQPKKSKRKYGYSALPASPKGVKEEHSKAAQLLAPSRALKLKHEIAPSSCQASFAFSQVSGKGFCVFPTTLLLD